VKPKIVNIVNFVRLLEPRDPKRDLREPVLRQIEISKQLRLPTTFLLEYDTLVDTGMMSLFDDCFDDPLFEFGGWLEIVQPLHF